MPLMTVYGESRNKTRENIVIQDVYDFSCLGDGTSHVMAVRSWLTRDVSRRDYLSLDDYDITIFGNLYNGRKKANDA